jgi:error-prone DNA polymerase
MGWDNPPVPWREFERRLSWGGNKTGETEEAPRSRPVTRLPVAPGRPAAISQDPAWAELHCHSSYSFLDGASSPTELVAEAVARGLTALAITDHDGMYGVPQFAQAAGRLPQASGTRIDTVFGAELSLDLPGGQSGIPDPVGRHLLVLARDPEGYRRLCRVISEAQLAGKEKGRPVYDEAALAAAHDGHWVVLTGCRKGAVPAALAACGLRTDGSPPGMPAAATSAITAATAAAAAELRSLVAMFGSENAWWS